MCQVRYDRFFKTSLFPPVVINSEVRSTFGRQQKKIGLGTKKYCELRYEAHGQAVQCYEKFECKLMKKVERPKGGVWLQVPEAIFYLSLVVRV